MEMLVYLVDHKEGARKVDIRTDLGLNPTTAIKAHRELMQMGLLKGIAYENATTYALTEAGEDVANDLKNIEKKMQKYAPNLKDNTNTMYFRIDRKPFKIGKDRPKDDD